MSTVQFETVHIARGLGDVIITVAELVSQPKEVSAMGWMKLSCFIGVGVLSALSVLGSLLYIAEGDPDGGWILIFWIVIAALTGGLFLRERKRGRLEFGGKFRRREGELYFNFGVHKGRSLLQVAFQEPQYIEHLMNSEFDPEVRYLLQRTLEQQQRLSATDETQENTSG